MNSISTYSILTTKKKSSLNTHFVFFCLLHLPVGISLIWLQQHQPIYWDSFLHNTSFPFGKSANGNICHIHQRLLPCLQEKYSTGKQRMKFQWLHDEISSHKISLPFSTFFFALKLSADVFKCLPGIFVAFNYVLMPWSSNGCLICGPNQIPSFILISFIMGNVCLK